MTAALLAGAALVASGAATAQPEVQPSKIGVVDLDRLVAESPQAEQAKSNMATRFAKRRNALELASAKLQSAIDSLTKKSSALDDDKRNQREAAIREQRHDLELKQSHYNDDVSAAESAELNAMRSDLRRVINEYAKSHGYDLIVGSSVLYASDRVDITDAILKRLGEGS